MGLKILNQEASIIHHFLAELRDQEVQRDSLRFRHNLSRLGEVMAYELSKELSFEQQGVTTVLGEAQVSALTEQPVLLTVLRAGVPFFEGFQRMFDRAPCGFIGAYRSATGQGSDFTIDLGYRAAPNLEGRTVILIDPMLATGKSLVAAMDTLKGHGTPAHWHLAAAIAAPEGADYLQKNISAPFTLWVGAIDDHLNDKAYIVPGLGDAGDLAYGAKE